jgi:CRP-like cAMP-binding protein
MPDDDKGIAPEAVGERLALALEQYLRTADQRGGQLMKLLTVVAKLLSDSQKGLSIPGSQMPELVEAVQQIAEQAGAAPSTGDAIAPAPHEDMQQMLSGVSELLAKQSATNDLLVQVMNNHRERLDEMDLKQIPVIPDEERKSDLRFVPYEEKEIGFLKESEVFGALGDDTLRTILANSSLEQHPPGETVFTVGDPVSEVYIIKSGIVEICRQTDDPEKLNVVAYLTSGDSIGEMSILISGDARSSIARVPEGAEILAINHETFMKLFRGLPEMAVRLASVFARRLKTSIKKERIHTRHRELSGTLQYFDLPTVIQTLLSSDERTGVLAVDDGDHDTIAELFFETGSIRYAKVGHLLGEEAFYQLFQMDLSVGSFSFKERKFAEGFDSKAQIDQPGMSLLFEAARLSDELKVLHEAFPNTERLFETKTEILEWDDPETKTLANGIWNLLKRDSTISDLLDSLPRSHYSIYSVLNEMKENGSIE